MRDAAARRAFVSSGRRVAGVLFPLLLSAAAPDTHAASAHVHGAAVLQVVVQGDRLEIEFTSPMENLVGFERAARTDKEKDALRRVGERLQEPEFVFVPSPAARCRRTAATVDASPPDKGGHAEVSVQATFRCERPADLKGLELKIFEAFPRLKRIDAQFAGPKKQGAAKLSTGSRMLGW